MRNKCSIFILIAILLMQIIDIGALDSIQVNADTLSPPDFTISRSMDKTVYTQGDIARLTYTITPTGQLKAPVQSNCDIVLIMDISTGMAGSKLSNAKSAAVSFINKIKAANASNKIGFVSFGYKVNKTIALTTDYNTVSNYVQSIQDTSLLSGSNFQDVLEKGADILSTSTAPNKYIVFMSDGEPNYFTSSVKIKQYEKNQFSKYENGYYYYTSYPAKTEKAYINAFDACKNLKDKKITMYSIGIGSSSEVDMKFLEKLSKATGGTAYQAALPDSLIGIFTQISNNIISSKISNLVIQDKLPTGINITNNSGITADAQGNISIALPDIVFVSNGPTPGSFTYVLELSLNSAGSYTMNNARIDYTDINSTPKSKIINSISFTVNSINQKPGLTATKQIDKTDLIEGDTATLTYTLTPTGAFYTGETRKPKDIVLVIDKSYGMGEDNKITEAKEAAEKFVNVLKAANQGDHVAVVTFNRYSRIEASLSDSYDTAISRIRQIQTDDGYSFDSGTNIEVALRTAQELLQSSTNDKQVILLSDGVPTYYLDKMPWYGLVPYYRYNGNSTNYVIEYTLYALWYYQPTNKNFYGSSMSDYGLKYEEYAYQQGSGTKGSENALSRAAGFRSANIAFSTVCVGGDEYADEEFMKSLADACGGKAYSTDTPAELEKLFEDIAKGLSYQKLSNIMITETLPANVEIVPSDGIIINGSTVTIKVPDIIFEKGKGTPNAVSFNINLQFNAEGAYVLSDVSKVDYTDYKGSPASAINLPKLNVTVNKGKCELSNVDIRAIDGTKQVSVIKKGKFDAVISFDVVKAGKLSLKLNSPAGSEMFYNSLTFPLQIKDKNGNTYKLSKAADGILMTTDSALPLNRYTAVIKFNVGSISENSYYLQIDISQGSSNPRLKVNVVALPIIM